MHSIAHVIQSACIYDSPGAWKHVPLFVILLCQDVHSLAADVCHALCNAAEVLFRVSLCQHSL